MVVLELPTEFVPAALVAPCLLVPPCSLVAIVALALNDINSEEVVASEEVEFVVEASVGADVLSKAKVEVVVPVSVVSLVDGALGNEIMLETEAVLLTLPLVETLLDVILVAL